MTDLSSGILAIDIETVSLCDNPDFENTSDWELLAVGLGYQPAPNEEIESEVIFREGGWDIEHTEALLQSVRDWCSDKKAPTVTYNGDRFDKLHLQNWAKQTANETNNGPLRIQFEILFRKHVDLKPLAKEYCREWPDRRNHASYEQVCEWEDISVPETRYDEYDAESLKQHPQIDAPVVTGKHIGAYLGEKYIEHHTEGTTEANEFQELKGLIKEYTESDIRPLIKLARKLDERYSIEVG